MKNNIREILDGGKWLFLKTMKQSQVLDVKGIDQDTMKFWIISNSNKIFGRLAVSSIVPFFLVP